MVGFLQGGAMGRVALWVILRFEIHNFGGSYRNGGCHAKIKLK